MKHLKLFEKQQQFSLFKDSENFILPNVTYVLENKSVYFTPKKPEQTFMLLAKYNATSDNLVAFKEAQNLKSLKVNGNSITIEPIKNETTTFDVLGENISVDMNTGAATFPESYLIKSPMSSCSFKAKDSNYTINENTCFCMLETTNGSSTVQPIPLSQAMGFYFTTNDGVTLEATDEFLAAMNAQIQSGLQAGFVLADVDMNNQTIVFIDTEHQTNVTTGGLSTYSFDSEGSYDVEIELADSVVKDIQFTGTPLISIEIGDNITSIGDNAFSGCTSLTDVTIGSGVTEIGEAVFAKCSSINEITCKGNIAPQIQNTTFGTNSTDIKKYGVLKVPANADYSSWMSTDKYYLGYYGWTYPNTPVYDLICTYNVKDISEDTQLYSTANADFEPLMMIINGEKQNASSQHKFNEIGQYEVIYRFLTPITEIKTGRFDSCSCLTSIIIPDSVTTIGGIAFCRCKGLKSISIPDSVNSIGIGAFKNSGLTSVDIPNSVTSINEDTFRECYSLTSINIPDSVTSIGEHAFYACRNLTGELVIPDSITSIGNNAFRECSGLTEVTIGSGVTSIGNNAFRDCSGLTGELVIPDGVTSIGHNAFRDCSGLTGEVIIPNGVTTIGDYTFENCSGLTSIVIPDSVTMINQRAFGSCSGLTTITCYATTAPYMPISGFFNISTGGTLYVPTGSDYSSWMSTAEYQHYLGKYNWTIQYI